MNDPYDILDCALRSRYLAPADLPNAPLWHRLPAELRSAFLDALADGEALKVIVPLVWQVRARLLGRPAEDRQGERTRATVRLRLGLLHLRYRERQISAEELLTCAFRVADSYVCDIDARPFLQLRRELEGRGAGGSTEARVSELFAPYTALAEECVERWGLRIRGGRVP